MENHFAAVKGSALKMLRRIMSGFMQVWVHIGVCVCVCVCVCLCVYLCIIDLFRASPLESWFSGQRDRGPPYRAESNVSETVPLFQAIIFPSLSPFSHPILYSIPVPLLCSYLFLASVLFFYQCSFQLLSSRHLFHLSSFYPHLSFSFYSSASHLRHISIGFLSPLLFLRSAHSLLQMSDQTEQHDSRRRAQFPLVLHSISNRTMCCV